MRFVDEAKISVVGGQGGAGCVSFRRETFIPRGGPDGGNGGTGGQVVFVASPQRLTLQTFRLKQNYQASKGHSGSSAYKSGKDGQTIHLSVPVGTVITHLESGQILADLTHPGQEWIGCQGGRGGKGNAHFVTATHQAPRFAQPGEIGEKQELKLEFKLITDVSLIGLPNAGKSSLLAKISAARPQIAEYPFTTKIPHLGVVDLPSRAAEEPSCVIADLPALSPGAHQGLGLGHRFLKHIERSRLLIYVLTPVPSEDSTEDLSDEIDDCIASRDPHLLYQDLKNQYQALKQELVFYQEKRSDPVNVLNKPILVVVNKQDLFSSVPEVLKIIQELWDQDNQGSSKLAFISTLTGFGIPELLTAIHGRLFSEFL